GSGTVRPPVLRALRRRNSIGSSGNDAAISSTSTSSAVIDCSVPKPRIDPAVTPRECSATVVTSFGILELCADLAERFAFPTHFTGCQVPLRAVRHTCRFEIGSLVANWAAHCRKPEAICAALDRRLVQAAKIALARAITDRMAVDAPRMRQHLAEFGKQCRRTLLYAGDRGKAFRRRQPLRCLLRGAISGAQYRQHAGQDRACDNGL